MPNTPALAAWLLAVSLVALQGCGGEAPAPASGGHAHVAPNGGALVELGDHAANLELVYEPSTGVVRLHVLDAHAEHYVRIAATELALARDGQPPLVLRAVANALSGETVGDSSRFEGTLADKPATWSARIPALDIRGMRFADVAIRYP